MYLQPGLRVQFQEEKQAYTVQASDQDFTVLTKPLNVQKTVLYTIIDWRQRVRGPENLVLCAGAETRKLCREMLDRLTNGRPDPAGGPPYKTQVSHRNRIRLRLRAILGPRPKKRR